MQIERESVAEVLDDLLVLYLAGEASPASRRLVESYAAENKSFAARLAKGGADSGVTLPSGRDNAMEVLRETRKYMKLQKVLFGLGIFFCMLPLTIVVRHGEVVFFLLRDAPVEAGASFMIGAGAWGSYWALQRKMRTLRLSLNK